MKLLAVDYDGTLYRLGAVSAYSLEQIQAWRQAGNLFGIVTGRSLESIQKEMQKVGLEVDFLITNNGGVQADGNGTVLSIETIDFSIALDIIAYIRTLDCISYVLNNGVSRSYTALKKHVQDLKYGNHDQMRSEYDLLKERTVAQIVLSVDDNIRNHDYADQLNERFASYIEAYPNLYCVDIVPKHVSKANGIAKMLETGGLCVEEVLCVGDQFNDASMLERYTGYTFFDSPAEIKALAAGIIEDVGDVIAMNLKNTQQSPNL